MLSNPYTHDKPDDATVLIYWEAKAVRRLDVLKPERLRVRRNGWLVTDSVTLAAFGVFLDAAPGSEGSRGSRKGAQGQGRRLDVEARKQVELHAEDLAEFWCLAHGWSGIERVGNKEAWDLEGLDGQGHSRYVEVKGTTGDVGPVEVTSGEVDAARRHGDSHLMIVVSGILLDYEGGRWRTGGGVVRVYDPWRPVDSDLTPLRFKWQPASHS